MLFTRNNSIPFGTTGATMVQDSFASGGRDLTVRIYDEEVCLYLAVASRGVA